MKLLVGIDLGSTSLKAIVYDERGNLVARGDRPMKKSHPDTARPEWTVWDPADVWNGAAAACRDAVAQLADPSLIAGVAVTGMGMDGLPLTEEGEPLYPMISWHDPRTQPQFDWWRREITTAKTFAIGGNPVWAINSALRMLWIKENEPEIYRRAFKWLLIEDFVNHRLTGRFATEPSMASCTMLFDQRTRSWSDTLCAAAGIRQELLPDVFPSATFLGDITPAAAAATHLPSGTRVFLGGHDHLCSALPVGAFRVGTVMNITGTWETVTMVATAPPLDSSLGEMGLTVQSHVAANRYAIWGGNPAGEIVEWFRQHVAGTDGVAADWETLASLASSARPGADGVLFLPHLGGASCPKADPLARGVFIGLNGRTTKAELTRAVIEGLDYQFLDTVREMEAGTGAAATEFIAVGGAIRNAVWMQNKADMTGRTVRVPEVEEATVLGAAILAGIGSGVFRDEEDAFDRVQRDAALYHPDERLTALYTETFPLYRELFVAVAPIHHKLAR